MNLSQYDIIDLFAGPGGWSEGLHALGLSELGLENDAAACATAEAAGHARLNVDIATTAPDQVCTYCRGLIGSPPCPGFSAAGKGLGRKDFEMLRAAIDAIASGRNPAHVLDDVRARQHDPRSALTLEPLRWALELEPEWIALEQVPTVLPLWEAYVPVLEADGYSVVTGNLHAEQYGVPQTRTRAVLLATRNGEATMPTPTHSLFHRRSPQKLDPGVKKWVSMAEALGRRPGDYLRSNYGTGGDPSKRGMRRVDEPAPTVTSKVDRNLWVPTPALEGDRPEDIAWPFERPSPTIVGSFHPEVVAAPGYRKAGDPPRQKTPLSVRVTVEEAAVLQSFRPDYPWNGGPKDTDGAKFQQVGNAVPPLLAAHVIGQLAGVALEAVS